MQSAVCFFRPVALLAGLLALPMGAPGQQPPDETGEVPAPRWEPQYKIKAHERARLAEADVPGPDGLVYPDWRRAGIAGGIPEVPAKTRLGDFGGMPNDALDDSAALEAAADAVGRSGGGAILLEEGLYHLDRPVLITSDGVVIRGRGSDRTRVIFRYKPPRKGVAFYQPQNGARIGPGSWIEAHADPDGLTRLAIEINGQVAAERLRGEGGWGERFSHRTNGARLMELAEPGVQTVTAVAEWSDATKKQTTVSVHLDPNHFPGIGRVRIPLDIGAIMFAGDEWTGGTWKLAQDGKRGDRVIVLEGEHSLRAGDRIYLHADATDRWNELVQNAAPWGTYRHYEFEVESVDGPRVRLTQPLRYGFPVIDGSYVRQIFPIERCGVEGLTLEQAEKIWTSGILFMNAWECWARDVHVLKAGRYPLYALKGKFCEIRDCLIDDAWYHGGGGTAYVGWENSRDCLMENVETFRMRHAPCLQWGASGNVIRNGVFHGSDGHWHSGWTNENLFENCVIEAGGEHGTYNVGLWASAPEDAKHGPNGPRNVVYNCDVSSPRTGLWMGGMNEGWMILYNRFVTEDGPGIVAKDFSFDHTIMGNVIVLRNPSRPVMNLRTPDCIGIEFVSNHVFGGPNLEELPEWFGGGRCRPAVMEANSINVLTTLPARPDPMVPSIFEWQRETSR